MNLKPHLHLALTIDPLSLTMINSFHPNYHVKSCKSFPQTSVPTQFPGKTYRLLLPKVLVAEIDSSEYRFALTEQNPPIMLKDIKRPLLVMPNTNLRILTSSLAPFRHDSKEFVAVREYTYSVHSFSSEKKFVKDGTCFVLTYPR
jgi:hypothetical protein